MSEKTFGVINEQGFLGEGFGFTEATEEEKAIFGDDSNKDEDKE